MVSLKQPKRTAAENINMKYFIAGQELDLIPRKQRTTSLSTCTGVMRTTNHWQVTSTFSCFFELGASLSHRFLQNMKVVFCATLHVKELGEADARKGEKINNIVY